MSARTNQVGEGFGLPLSFWQAIMCINAEDLFYLLKGVPKEFEKTLELTCEKCGRTSLDVRPGIEPYASEIFDEENWVLWCDDCFTENAMDI